MEELHLVAIATGRGRNIDKPPTIFSYQIQKSVSRERKCKYKGVIPGLA
jgi:hypothetical protein